MTFTPPTARSARPATAAPAAELFALPSGLTLAAQPRAGAAFALSLRVPWGSAHDPLGLEGTAGVLEEWLFKGAADRDARALADAFDALGLRHGGGVGTEATRLSLSGLNADLPAALRLLADVVRRPALPASEVPVLADLARQDLEGLQDTPEERLALHTRAAVFGGPRPAQGSGAMLAGFGHPVSGTHAGLSALTAQSLRDAHARWGAQGSLLAVVADLSAAEIREQVEEVFGDWAPGTTPEAPEPHFHAGVRSHLSHAGSEQTHLSLSWPAVGANHPDYLPSQLALTAFSGGSASRLFHAVREERGLAYAAHASALLLGSQGFWQLGAASTPSRAQETLDVLLAETERLRLGLTTHEFERARRGLLTGLAFSEEGLRARAGAMLRDLVLLGRLREPGELRGQLRAITLEEVNGYLAALPDPLPGAALVTLGRAPLSLGAQELSA
ncbi:peptidase M16 domain protein [Deinococcus proteolyticus MRP]|uniref:Peptidase M16 domain protein n=1 Tax=Deinococcus proteolyticus (strain ATCC 35074 / DSM 20540 / JCM 6276 / NBRC 101906 / NCIMB 13154 / VKM Ac-1939 / CCM 2703 / MRP) TaxID=693977 RepID=F0RIV4_DEIPM|nr:pitrilysin family protein [Deinococcus proteolyticus]ADY25213.1 peptidase M16 domain protein [Deinococcus proteolyticus MRP]